MLRPQPEAEITACLTSRCFHSEFQIVLFQQVRPGHPQSRDIHGQKSGKTTSVQIGGITLAEPAGM